MHGLLSNFGLLTSVESTYAPLHPKSRSRSVKAVLCICQVKKKVCNLIVEMLFTRRLWMLTSTFDNPVLFCSNHAACVEFRDPHDHIPARVCTRICAANLFLSTHMCGRPGSRSLELQLPDSTCLRISSFLMQAI